MHIRLLLTQSARSAHQLHPLQRAWTAVRAQTAVRRARVIPGPFKPQSQGEEPATSVFLALCLLGPSVSSRTPGQHGQVRRQVVGGSDLLGLGWLVAQQSLC